MYTHIQYALPKGNAEPVTKVRAPTDTKTSTDENQTVSLGSTFSLTCLNVVSCRDLGLVAQRLEQRTHNPLVPGSNPGGPTKSFQRLSLFLLVYSFGVVPDFVPSLFQALSVCLLFETANCCLFWV